MLSKKPCLTKGEIHKKASPFFCLKKNYGLNVYYPEWHELLHSVNKPNLRVSAKAHAWMLLLFFDSMYYLTKKQINKIH